MDECNLDEVKLTPRGKGDDELIPHVLQASPWEQCQGRGCTEAPLLSATTSPRACLSEKHQVLSKCGVRMVRAAARKAAAFQESSVRGA